jgi:hypothetical protein
MTNTNTMTVSVGDRAYELHTSFARRVLEAVAKRLEVGTQELLEAVTGSGRPSRERGQLRERFADLAAQCYPEVQDPARALLRLCRGEAVLRPVFVTLARLEAALGVSPGELFGGER